MSVLTLFPTTRKPSGDIDPPVPRPRRATGAASSQAESWDRDNRIATGQHTRLVSLYCSAPELTAQSFLDQALGQPRFYWATPAYGSHDSTTIAGSGIAAEVAVEPVVGDRQAEQQAGHRFREAERLARDLLAGANVRASRRRDSAEAPVVVRRPRFFGGFAFRDDFVPDNTWSVFKPAQFVLPHYLFVESEAERYLIINAIVSPEEDIEVTFEALEEALELRRSLPAPVRAPAVANVTDVTYPLTQDAWREMAEKARRVIASGELDKVVLARVCELRCADIIDAAALLPYLDESYPTCYRFLFEPLPNHAFVGATPELLVCKQGTQIEAMALAGSAPRGSATVADDELGRALLASAKDLQEHQYVVDAVRSQLADFTDRLTVSERPSLLLLPNIQHLLTTITGRLRENEPASVLDLVCALHPTPAMGGVPVDRATAFLHAEEPVPRGWYAAPVGWFDEAMDGVFAVAIRSGVTQLDRAWLYAGAGIVADSQPEREWAETALKFRPMLTAFNTPEASQ